MGPGIEGSQAPWVAGLGATFLALGVLFVGFPRPAAALFGIPASDAVGLAYVPVVGLRDLAFGLAILALGRFGGARALGLFLACSAVIPAGDLVLVARERGLDSPLHLGLHGLSGLVVAGTAFMLLNKQTHTGERQAP